METAEERKAREAKEAQEAADAALEERIARVASSTVNAAISSHMKRAAKDNEKTVADIVAKALEGFKASMAPADGEGTGEGSEPAKGPKGAPAKGESPSEKLLREKFEKLEKQLADERTARTAIETKARKDSARGDLLKALETKGVKGARASALASHLEATGQFYIDEDGKPTLKVSRSRSKGAAAEELAFDVAQGIEDWTKTDDAKDFLPAPGSAGPVVNGRPGAVQAPRRVGELPRYDKPAITEEEMARRTAEQLAAQGVDLNQAFRR